MRRKLLKKCHLLKCTSFLLLWLIVAHVFAQITISVQNRSLRETLREIERTSDYKFFYNETLPGLDEDISIQLIDAGIEVAMQHLLAGTGIEYQKSGDVIALVAKPVVAQAQPPATTTTQQATSRNVTGTIIDASNNETIIGANVWIRESARGTVTDIDGHFSIPVSNNSTVLVISFIGMEDLQIEVGNRADLGTIHMRPSAQALEELVVIGHGVQRRESVIGAISTISPADLQVPSSRISNILAGRLSGVVAMTRTGEPGAGTDFFIRGVSSFGTAENARRPLVLVDGVERDLDLVDPEDIESFSILKDATATAIYGVRGANGVVIVTTRRGAEGPPRINARVERGISMPTKLPRMVNSEQWARMYNEATGVEFYSPEAIEAYRTGSDNDLFPNSNWMSAIFRDFSEQTRANLNVSGGGSISRYFIAGSILDEGSIFRQADDTPYNSSLRYRRINFRANIDVNVTPSTVLNVNLANIYETRRRPGFGNLELNNRNHGMNEIWGRAFRTSPNAYPTRFSNGFFAGPTQGAGFNPYNLALYSGFSNDFWNAAQTVVGVTQDLGDLVTPGLRANVRFSWDAHNTGIIRRVMDQRQWRAIGRDENGELILEQTHIGQETLAYARALDGRRINYFEASATYERVFAQRHRIGGLFMYNQRQRNQLNSETAVGSLPFRSQGIAGRATYGFDDRYFAEFNAGYNGSENFARGHRFGFFPAGAIGWMVSNENFWDPMRHVMDRLRFRSSYGLVGNDDIGGGRRFVFESTIVNETGNRWAFGETGGTNEERIRSEHPSNPYVTWETSRKFNVGLEFSLFNSLRVEADYFHDHRSGIFLQRAGLSGLVGLTTMPWVNVGKMQNQGLDASLQFNRRVGNVNLEAMGNFTYTQNRLIDNDQPDWAYPHLNRIGKPWNQPFALVALGLFESEEEIANSPRQTFGPVRPGDIKYLDVNGDGIIDSRDEVAIGFPTDIPGIVYGFGLSAQWRGFDASAFFQGVGRITIFAEGNSLYPFVSSTLLEAGMHEAIYHQRWTEENPDPNARFPRITTGANGANNNRRSTWRMYDGSFVRLRNAEIGYTIPRRLVERFHISSLRVYASGTNLLTFSSFDLWDPERGTGQGDNYPPTKTLLLGLSVNF